MRVWLGVFFLRTSPCRWWLTMSSLSSVISAQIRCLVQEGYPYLDERRESHGASVHERHAMRLADERVSAASADCSARNDRWLSSRRSKDNCVQASPSVPCGGDQSRLGAGHRGPRSAGCEVERWYRCGRRGVVLRLQKRPRERSTWRAWHACLVDARRASRCKPAVTRNGIFPIKMYIIRVFNEGMGTAPAPAPPTQKVLVRLPARTRALRGPQRERNGG